MNYKNVICELVMTTYDEGPSLSGFVSKVIKRIKSQNKVKYQLTPMGTILEGNWKDVYNLVDDLFNTFSNSYNRIVLTFKVDYKNNRKNRMYEKVKSVEEKVRYFQDE